MLKFHNLRFIPLAFYLSIKPYGVSNSDFPNNGHNADSSLMVYNNLLHSSLILSNNLYNYKGIWYLGNSWWIKAGRNVPLSIRNEDESQNVIYSVIHSQLNFTIFKTDSNILQHLDLRNLATKEELESSCGEVISLALVPDLVSELGFIDLHLDDYQKPFFAFSIAEKSKNGKFLLTKRNFTDEICQKIWPNLRQKKIEELKKQFAKLENLSNEPIQMKNLFEEKTEFIHQQINKLDEEIKKDLWKIIRLQNQINQSDVEFKLCHPFTEYNQIAHKKVELQNQILLIKTQNIASSQATKQYFESILADPDNILQSIIGDINNYKNLHEQDIQILDHLNDNYLILDIENKQKVKEIISDTFSNYIYAAGVADQEDNGGLIIMSNSNHLKLVGFTCLEEGDDYKQGEKSFAIDLTAPKVHKWILEKIKSVEERINYKQEGIKYAIDSVTPTAHEFYSRIMGTL